MKDENGIEIDCQNCEAFEYCKDSSAYEQCQNKAFSPSKEAYEARIAELQTENALLKELRFTDKEIDLIRNTFQEQIWEDKCGWSAEKKIIAKCDELLKVRKDNNGRI